MQNLTPFFSDDDYAELALHIQERLDQLQQLPYPQVRDAMFDLLNSIDMMHREAFVRLLLLIQHDSPNVLARLEDDVVVRSVLALYELLPNDSPDVGPPAPATGTFIPLDAISVSPGIKEPIWIPGGYVADLPAGSLRAQKFEDVEVLLCNVGGDIYALRNACLNSILPLSSGSLDGYILNCPWHGCRYDVRTGEIQNSSGLKLERYPVRLLDNGKFTVGFNIPKHDT
ncbi:MAG: hypothetical protein FOGNACKC_01301 [Anaerolineae bacterium]|nr:hypothetical protein [Anaerolineae bacterium]